MPRSRIVAATWIVLACTSHSADEPREQQPHDEPREPPCVVLPAEAPPQAMVEYRHDDSEHRLIYDVAYVVEATCPAAWSPLVSAPECVRLTREALQIIWTNLRELDVHRIETVDRGGECIHCGLRSITVSWPGARCSVGSNFETEISADAQDRFYEAARYLDAVSERVLGRRDE